MTDSNTDAGATAVEETVPEATPEEQFRDEQRALALDQGLTAENAVPEKRPIASQQSVATDSELTQKMRDAGLLQEEPMGLDAYERADSDAQKRKAEKNSKVEGIHVGNLVKVTNEDSPHFGRLVAVTGIVSYRSDSDLALANSGSPEVLWVNPLEIRGTAIRDDRDGEILVLNVDDEGLVKVQYQDNNGRR